jgi:hypothetical protein
MTRLVKAPLVGAVVGALEGGIVFALLSTIEVEQGAYSGVNDELIYVAILMGVIIGIIVGGVIGLIVALLNAGSLRGLLLGFLVGLALSIYLFVTSSYQNDIVRMLAVIVIPAAASTGLISAVLSAGRKEQQPSSESPRSHRIIS